MYIVKAVRHFKTITEHRHMVMKHCKLAGIPVQGFFHDLSKYSPAEFFVSAKYYTGTYSPNVGERKSNGFSKAWMHHKGRNKHHFEYWTDYSFEKHCVMPVKMPLRYVIEMFCDRVAAGKIYNGDAYTQQSPYEYYDKGRSLRVIHPETAAFLEKLLKMLSDRGEDITFAYIRHYLRTHKDY